ncbi:DeoR/GlpR family DNA-binding transcription regulator [Proteiniphilum sp.]|uniref:DeoR/GlpR family DNA-binding transcription regulator n=1 Tax=Proteiniphilum sp. TaxID=1926877 RepID=UPI002B211D55|nr:DeoR/GlpR family DNA-binding transcription regulator [Proteiniphilum sp.]MEA4917178.1 DeoR/GlpR family DNA-binding transcription regulator [Proteiniphilum sp.]
MLKEERHKIIMKEINLHHKVLSVDLSSMLNVSEDTIRRDLKELSEEDRIIKVHGGAISKSFVRPFVADNNIYAHEEKKKIAKKALSLLQNDMTLLFEGGTTILELANQLPSKINLTIFTVSPQVAITLSNFENIKVYTIGGNLSKNANIHTGASVINDISDIKYDICFMGVSAISIEKGITDMDWETVQVNKAMIKASSQTVLLAISEKLNISKKYKVADLDDISHLITELDPEDKRLSPYNKKITII